MSKGKELPQVSTPDGATPKATVGRLSLYLRQLESFHKTGHETISSTQLGQALEITDAQVRKDLAFFGQFGYPGIGYRVVELRDSLKGVLGTNRTWQVALIGVGNLGRALLGYRGFRERGFEIAALFDNDPALVGRHFSGMQVSPTAELRRRAAELNLQLAILAVPPTSADQVVAEVLAAGIAGILNFAPIPLKVPDEISMVSVDLGLQLEQLAFQVNQRHCAANNGG